MRLVSKSYNIKIRECISFKDRFIGFMFKKNIDEVLCFRKCSGIHTFFMFNPIEVIMTDKDFKVLYVYNYLKKNRIILPKKGVYYTFEMKAYLIDCTIGEKLNIEKE